jgi:tellurite resistance protein TehA-like permease
VSQLGATALWGLGLWWLAVASALLVRYARTTGVPFGLGWWAFTFPLGAFTVATLTLARLWGSSLLEWFAVVLYLALVGFWGTVTVRTVGAARTGEAWGR